MTRDEAVARARGRHRGRRATSSTAGARCLLTGDMGIANTTASAALIAAFTGADAGRGHRPRHRHRRRHVRPQGRRRPAGAGAAPARPGRPGRRARRGRRAGARRDRRASSSARAAQRVPVMLDGVIAGAAALVAAGAGARRASTRASPGHRSAEPGHTVALAHLGLRPLLDLELRLGEGTGAVLALPLVQAAVRALREMATFDSAGVAEKDAGRGHCAVSTCEQRPLPRRPAAGRPPGGRRRRRHRRAAAGARAARGRCRRRPRLAGGHPGPRGHGRRGRAGLGAAAVRAPATSTVPGTRWRSPTTRRSTPQSSPRPSERRVFCVRADDAPPGPR